MMSELPDSPSEAANIAGEGGDLTLEEAERLVVEVELELAAIDRALGRVDSRTYGNCTVCGATIPPELLRWNHAMTKSSQ